MRPERIGADAGLDRVDPLAGVFDAAVEGVEDVPVVPGPAEQLVVHAAGAAHQDVVAAKAGQDIGAARAHQHIVAPVAVHDVVEVRADGVLDRGEVVEGAVAVIAGPLLVQPHHNPGRGQAVVGGVDTGPAVQGVDPAAAAQHIGPGAASHDVGQGVAGAGEVAGPAEDQVLDIVGQGVGVDPGVDGVGPLAGEFDDAVVGLQHIEVVAGPSLKSIERARAAPDHVVAGEPQQNVGPQAAAQDVGPAVADQDVVEGRAGQVLDPDQGVGPAVAVIARGPGVELGAHARRGPGVVDGVDAAAAVEHIDPGAADQHIVAVQPLEGVVPRAARQAVVPAVAGQGVVEGRAQQGLDPREAVRAAVAVVGGAAEGQAGGHPAGRRRIVGRVEAASADQQIRPRPAAQNVVADAAVEGVRTGPAAQDVIAAEALEMDIERAVIAQRADLEAVVAAVAADRAQPGADALDDDVLDRREGDGGVDHHPGSCRQIDRGRGAAQDGRVDARAADDQRTGRRRRAGEDQGVVAVLAVEIVAGVAFDRVVPVAAVHPVDAGSTDQGVVAQGAGQDVIAGAAVERHPEGDSRRGGQTVRGAVARDRADARARALDRDVLGRGHAQDGGVRRARSGGQVKRGGRPAKDQRVGSGAAGGHHARR